MTLQGLHGEAWALIRSIDAFWCVSVLFSPAVPYLKKQYASTPELHTSSTHTLLILPLHLCKLSPLPGVPYPLFIWLTPLHHHSNRKLPQKAWLDPPFPMGSPGFLCTANKSLLCHSFRCFKILYLSICLIELNSYIARGCHINDETHLTRNLAHICSQ